MIDPKCPECGALLKKRDLKNDKCWKCKAENIAEYFSIQEDKKKAEEKERKGELTSKERKELEDKKIELERKRQESEDIETRKAKESSRPLSEKEKEKHYWSFLYRLNSWLTVEIVITLGIILSLIFSIYGMFDIFGSYDRMSGIYQKIIWVETIGIIIFSWKTVTIIQLKVSLAPSTVKES